MPSFNKKIILALSDAKLSKFDKAHCIDKFYPEALGTTKGCGSMSKLLSPLLSDLQRGWEEADSTNRWNALLHSHTPDSDVYRISPAKVEVKALNWLKMRLKREVVNGERRAPLPRSNRVTDFSGWIYDLCMGSKRDNAARDGKQGEREFALRRKEEAKRSVFKGAELSSWELIFEDPLDGSRPAKAISSLEIDGRSMFGMPDYVFKEKATGRILILEIKTTRYSIPSDGWPNLRAQLWCYSRIDEWQDAPEILLRSTIIDRAGNTRMDLSFELDHTFDAQNMKLFEIYKEAMRALKSP